MATVLYELCSKHPTPLSYEDITEILKHHNLIMSDVTRMHRKLSEIRQSMSKFHPSLENFVLNTRCVGYSLPLRLKNIHQTEETKNNTRFSNQRIIKTVEILRDLINDSIDMTAHTKIVKHAQGYVIDRDPVRNSIVEHISAFNECEKIILKEIRTHEADFTGLRIAYVLAKLKTYVGLARLSEYPISMAQWLDWFKQEVWSLFEELKKLIRFLEQV